MNYMILWIAGGFFLLVFVYHMSKLFRFGTAAKHGADALQRGDLDSADRHFQKALRIARGLHKGQFESEVMAWLNLSLLAKRRRAPEKPVEWHDCGAKVFIPFWESEIAKFADVFLFVRFKDLPSIIPDRAAARVGSEYNAPLSAEANRIYAQVLVGRAAGLALLRDGWTGTGAPGDPVWFSKGPRRMNPSALVKDLWTAKLKDTDWRATASEAGVSDLPLTC